MVSICFGVFDLKTKVCDFGSGVFKSGTDEKVMGLGEVFIVNLKEVQL